MATVTISNSRGSLNNWFIGGSGRRSSEIGERLDRSGRSLLGLLFGDLQGDKDKPQH